MTSHHLAYTQHLPISGSIAAVCVCGEQTVAVGARRSYDETERDALDQLGVHIREALEARRSAPSAGRRPTGPGQTVKSRLDGTLGVATSRPRKSGSVPLETIDVMFIGSAFDGPFAVEDLTTVNLTEA